MTKRRLRRLMLVALLAALCLPLALWALVTQPLLPFRKDRDAPAVEAGRLEAHVRALSETFSPRDHSHAENLDRAAAYVRAEFERAGASVSEQTYAANGRAYRNVVARLGPETPERVVVGAHYDAAGPLPGADDNASGVAGLIELARLLGRAGPRTRVELVAYPLEEPPYFRTRHMGSAVHASSLKAEGARVRLMVSLEMIGYFSDEAESQHFPVPLLRAFYPSRGNFVSVIGSVGQWRAVRRVKGAMRDAAEIPSTRLTPRALSPASTSPTTITTGTPATTP